MKRLFLSVLPLIIPFFFIACAPRSPHPPWLLRVSSLGPHVGSEEILKLPEGDPVPFSRLIDGIASSRVIFIGEAHDQVEHHRVQERVLLELLNQGRRVVVAMEMFQRSQQSILDRWSQGALAEEEFLRETGWETTRELDYSLYKRILDTAKDRRLKVLGLNVSKDLTRKVAQSGVENLSIEDRRLLPDMDLTDRDHRRYLRPIFEAHQDGKAKDFEYFYQAQCLWDEAMAETLSGFLASSDAEGKTVLVLAGNAHIVFDFGIPKRLDRRGISSYQTIVLKEWREEPDTDLFFSEPSQPLADFLWITPPAPHPPKIGVVLKEDEDPNPIRIERVIPESPAEKAGLRPGDRFLSVDGREIKTLKDLHDAVARRSREKEIEIIILREGERIKVLVTLPDL